MLLPDFSYRLKFKQSWVINSLFDITFMIVSDISVHRKQWTFMKYLLFEGNVVGFPGSIHTKKQHSYLCHVGLWWGFALKLN
jgi:hypothetical protein